MNVQYYKPNRLSDPEERSMKVTYKPLDELIKTSDFITINAPKHLIHCTNLMQLPSKQ